jgi:hypothetical protein
MIGCRSYSKTLNVMSLVACKLPRTTLKKFAMPGQVIMVNRVVGRAEPGKTKSGRWAKQLKRESYLALLRQHNIMPHAATAAAQAPPPPQQQGATFVNLNQYRALLQEQQGTGYMESNEEAGEEEEQGNEQYEYGYDDANDDDNNNNYNYDDGAAPAAIMSAAQVAAMHQQVTAIGNAFGGAVRIVPIAVAKGGGGSNASSRAPVSRDRTPPPRPANHGGHSLTPPPRWPSNAAAAVAVLGNRSPPPPALYGQQPRMLPPPPPLEDSSEEMNNRNIHGVFGQMGQLVSVVTFEGNIVRAKIGTINAPLRIDVNVEQPECNFPFRIEQVLGHEIPNSDM